ncbi:MAG: hypothetical protein ACYC6G_19260 [Desulfobaccales bacterium]
MMDLVPLKLFNERAERLKESRFLAWLRKSPMDFDKSQPDDLDAFCLNLRLLIQDRDGFSINCLSKLYNKLPDSPDILQEAKNLFELERIRLNTYLNKRSFVQIEGRNFSNKDLFNILFYGGLVHNNLKYFNDYRKFMKSGWFSILAIVALWNIFFKFNSCIQRINVINKIIIEQMEKSGNPD